MKYRIGFLILSALFSIRIAAAQPSAPLTRAQVLEELYRLEAAGYNPSAGDQGSYPADIQAAEAKIAAQQAEDSTPSAVARVPQPGVSVPANK